MADSNYQFLMKQKLGSYAGKWIAVIDKKIMASDTIEALLKSVRAAHGNRKPLIMKVPGKEEFAL
jgi:hypothetical protein